MKLITKYLLKNHVLKYFVYRYVSVSDKYFKHIASDFWWDTNGNC